MIKYLKSEIGVVKINTETKEALVIVTEGDIDRVSSEVLDEDKYILITLVKVQEEYFVEITEEEFNSKKEEIKNNLIKLGF
jgi:hypothetical protein